jgi:hypothetical protein
MISKQKSTYGEFPHNLLIIEISELEDNTFQEIKRDRESINKILNENIIFQNKEDTQSGNNNRIFVKKEVNIENKKEWDNYIKWQINIMKLFFDIFSQYDNSQIKNNISSIKKGITNMKTKKHNSLWCTRCWENT